MKLLTDSLVTRMDLRNSQLVAVKVMEADVSDYTDSSIQNRDQTIKDFQNEVGVLQKLRGLETPNVNKILDSFLVYDQLWIVAEYCAGGSVHTLVSQMQYPCSCRIRSSLIMY